MPPHYQAHSHPRTSTRRTSSSFNAFGHDPNGRVAHVVQHLFGPWVPHIVRRVRFTGQRHAPPRYGPPTASQIPWLPTSFIPRNPPSYHGLPRVPHLLPPLSYEPAVFTAIVSRPRRYQVNGAILVEENAPVVGVVPGGMCTLFWFTKNTHGPCL